MPIILGQLASGEDVYDRDHDPHLEVKPTALLQLLPEVFAKIDSNTENRLSEMVKFPFEVGQTHCVDTSDLPTEDIYYAMIRGRRGYSRFIGNCSPRSTKWLSAILTRHEIDRAYVLLALYPGKCACPEPWQMKAILNSQLSDPLAAVRAWKFWQKHAFVEGYKPIIESTITRDCPWQLRSSW